MKNLLLILLIFLCLAQFGCSFGQEIEGQIVDSQNNPIEGATIKLLVWDQKKDDFPTKTIDATQSGRNGEFGIKIGDEAPDTKLVLDVEKDGFKLAIMKFTPLLIQKNKEVFKNYRVVLEEK